MERIEIFLQNLGLNKKQIALYIASLKYGTQPASVLAKRADLVRPTAYHELNVLIEQGIFTKKIVSGVTKFMAIPPESLEYIVDSRFAAAKKLKNDYGQLLPEFNKLKTEDIQSSDVSFYSGVDGLCRMLDDFSLEDESVLYISSHNKMDERLRRYVSDAYIPRSNMHTNKNKIILNEGAKSREYSVIAKDAYDEFVYIDSNKYKLNLTTAIYSDKVAFWSYKPDDLSGVIIKNKNVNEDMRKYFDIIKEYFILTKDKK